MKSKGIGIDAKLGTRETADHGQAVLLPPACRRRGRPGSPVRRRASPACQSNWSAILSALSQCYVVEAENLLQETSGSVAAFARIDARNVQKRRNLHRERAVVVGLGFERPHEIIGWRAQFGRVTGERTSVRQKGFHRSVEQRPPITQCDLLRNLELIIGFAA